MVVKSQWSIFPLEFSTTSSRNKRGAKVSRKQQRWIDRKVNNMKAAFRRPEIGYLKQVLSTLDVLTNNREGVPILQLDTMNLICKGYDVGNAFAGAPAPTSPFFMKPDAQFRQWWEEHLGKDPIPTAT
ncbi:hypothetical protein FRACYDRAFT_234338 [Fragilariopsis cylindrus CCMP1102]|uniref:Uncharacterized protein n=1 Tax=Fragilariopsis cylindrus CCMP1102 TaxID=635003 RepID=A0A1E7FRD0_9STRA|nr:hypothetical protein FRACYDRAFT_234338 [Fragilariopsis cylindrus CCMP1102]|eukprot:OEU20706.1 hypothetical protein FRACYDRAFT_234338 [Fragilariopsis cylindrus CCMP1102]